MSIDRRRLILCISAFAGQGLAAAAFAQNWPDRAIVIVVPFPVGGSADLSARLLAENLKAVFGQPVVVENKPGAGGNLAAAEAARAEPDGYTLFIGTDGTQTINQSLYRQLPYDPAAKLATQVAQSLASSLDHLGTDHVDSFVLHGPSSNYDWTDADA